MIPFITYRWIWYAFFSVLFIVSIAGVIWRGIPYGIDFTGGSLMEVEYTKEVPELSSVSEVLSINGFSTASLQQTERGYLIRLEEINEEQRKVILTALRGHIGQTTVGPSVQVEPSAGTGVAISGIDIGLEGEDNTTDENQVSERRFDSVGPVIGQELKVRSVQALILVILSIMAYIAWAFRKVSWPVKSWKYGGVAVAVLFYDVIVTFGAYVWVASHVGWVVDTIFVAALLTILGYSVNDRIVVFDRVRENLPRMDKPFDEIVNASVNQTLARSLNTGLATILVMAVIMLYGGETLRPFMFTLLFGVILGTVSSIFLAAPLLVTWQLSSEKRQK